MVSSNHGMTTSGSLADREPCPFRIIDDIGGAFCMGAIGGSIWHLLKGSLTAPKGARLLGATNAITARAPVIGGQFAIWGGLFACCDCTLTSIRQKEDPWNSIMSGAVTGGILAARAGPKAMTQAAVVGGVILALIEGLGIMVTQMMSTSVPTPEELRAAGVQRQQMDPTAPPTTGGFTLSKQVMNTSDAGPNGSTTKTGITNPMEWFMGSGSTMENNDISSTSFGTEGFSVESSNEVKDSTPSKNSSWWPF